MRAVVHDRYGPPEGLEVRDVPLPEPAGDEIRVQVHATTVNRTDTGFLRGEPHLVRLFAGLLRPRRTVLGNEFAGVVDAVGGRVTRFAVGERVFGVNADRFGTHAEHVCVGEARPVAAMPEGIGFEVAAAACDGAILALAYLRSADVGPGTRVLVYGASGAIGSAAVQLAKHRGAHVTAVTQSPGLDVVRTLGADDVVGTDDDLAALGTQWDLVLDAVGKRAFRDFRAVLAPDGTYTSTDFGPWHQNPALAVWTRVRGGQRVRFPLPRYTREDVELVAGLLASGEFRPVIDRVYPLDDVVEATRYVETQRKIGNVVLSVVPPEPGPAEPG